MCTPQCFIENCGGLAFDEAIKAAKYVLHYTKNLSEMGAKMTELGNRMENTRRKVCEANDRGEEIDVEVSHWQPNADRLKNDIEQLIRDSTTRANMRCIACSCPNITWRYKLSKQAEEKIGDADKLIEKSDKFTEISHPRPRPQELESLSDKNYVNFDSRASIFKDIVKALEDSNVNMIGVFGLGGVGKTTLVKEVGEQMRKDGTFKQVAMAAVSENLNVKEVQSRLAASLNFKFKVEADDQVGRATELWHKLTNGDKYLIILDDIWEEVKMEAIGIPCTNEKKGCKVVLTSRNEDLLSTVMEVDRNFSIAILSSAEAWILFMKKVGNSIESQPKIKSLACEVCERCKGLPVAINALGEALKGKQEHAWKTTLDKLDKYMLTKIVGINPSVLASLRVSYDMLHSADAKSCFLFCCLFGEDADISLDGLTSFWFAGSFLAQKPCTLEEARNDVHTLVDALKSASLLSNGNDENVVKIHDVIRDVGISIAREEEAFLVDHGALRWPQNPPNGPSYSAISLIFKNVNEHPDGLVYPKLHTLIVANSKLSDLEFPDNFFNGMMQLTMLIISRIRMRRLPSSLAKLKNLRMLGLNECELDDIAILKDLKSNLEVLWLSDSSIKALPPEIGQLTSLRVLDLCDCDKLTVIPRGVISKLTNLEELYFPEDFGKWGATIDEQRDTCNKDNVSLEELRWLLKYGHLTTLHIYIPNVKLLPKEDLKFADLKGFRISVGSKFRYNEALISRRCMLKLEGIQLRNEFIPLVEKAEVLVLKLESSVHPLRFFNKLTVLIIKHFKLKYLFSPTTARGFVHLEVLKVTSCEIMEGIIGFEGQKDENEITGEVKFSKLKELKLKSLPNLISFFAKKEEMGTTMGSFSARAQPLFNEQVIFPVLERLTIDRLGNIIKIWDKQSVAVLEDQGSFCQLTYLEVRRCSKLMHVFPSNMHPQLKNLEELVVEECETMKGIVEFEGEIDEDGHRNEVASPAQEHLEMVGVIEIQDKQPLPEPKKEVESLCRPVNNDDIIVFPRLKDVSLCGLPELKSFYSETQGFFSHKVIFPVLKKLSIRKVHKIIEIWDKQSIAILEEQGSFCQLTDLDVSECEKLMHVFPSKMHSPLKNLKVLRMNDCPTMEGIVEFEGEMDEDGLRNEVCFSELSSLELSNLPNLESFFTKLGKAGTTEGNSNIHALPLFNGKVIFPVLKKLSIRKVRKIIEIWDKQSIAIFEEQGSFCQLTDLDVDECEKLMHVFPSKMHSPLNNLKLLRVCGCPTMKGIVEFEGEIDEDGLRNEGCFSKLSHLTLSILPNLESFCTKLGKADTIEGNSTIHALPLFNGKVVFPVLKSMWLWNLGEITRIWDDQPLSEKEAKSFSELEDIFVSGCDQLEYVLPSYMLPQLKNLQKLNIENCTKVDVIISNNLKDKEATNNNDIIQFPQLKTLTLSYLPNLKSFICSDETQSIFSNKVDFPVLKRMNFNNLDKITRIWDDQPLSKPEKEAKSFSELEDINVSGCDQLEYVLPSYMLLQLKNLQELNIESCTKVEVIISNNPKEKEATNNNDTIWFPQLKTLVLKHLPVLKSFICSDETQSIFSYKVAFPVLERLLLAKLDNITRIWDNQPLLEPEKEAKSFCKLMVIIVVGCEDLEYALPFYMLPQLKNLEELRIERCRKMEVIISNNPKEKEDTNNNYTIRFHQLKTLNLGWLPNFKSFICSEKQLFFSNKVQIKDAFPVLESISIEDLKSPTKKGYEEDLHVRSVLWSLRSKHLEILTKKKKVSVEDPFPVLIQLILDEDSEILRDGTYTKEVSMEECSTSGKESNPNGEELDEDLETPTKEISMEECSTSGEESDHNGEELDEDLETPTKEECGTSGKQNDHNGEQGRRRS